MKNSDTPATPFQEVRGITGGMITKYENHKGLTKREQACINLGIPETGDPELDALIIKSERKRIAAKFMASWINHHGLRGDYDYNSQAAAKLAFEDTDALLEELEK